MVDTKTARQTIFESGGVGIDLRAPSRRNAITSTSTTFVKPAGVDDPKNIQSSTSTAFVKPAGVDEPKNTHSLPISGTGARRNQTKRERDSAGEPSDQKRVKKRKSE